MIMTTMILIIQSIPTTISSAIRFQFESRTSPQSIPQFVSAAPSATSIAVCDLLSSTSICASILSYSSIQYPKYDCQLDAENYLTASLQSSTVFRVLTELDSPSSSASTTASTCARDLSVLLCTTVYQPCTASAPVAVTPNPTTPVASAVQPNAGKSAWTNGLYASQLPCAQQCTRTFDSTAGSCAKWIATSTSITGSLPILPALLPQFSTFSSCSSSSTYSQPASGSSVPTAGSSSTTPWTVTTGNAASSNPSSVSNSCTYIFDGPLLQSVLVPMPVCQSQYTGSICNGIISSTSSTPSLTSRSFYLPAGYNQVQVESAGAFVSPLFAVTQVSTGCREAFARTFCDAIFPRCDLGAFGSAMSAAYVAGGSSDKVLQRLTGLSVAYPRQPCRDGCMDVLNRCANTIAAVAQTAPFANCSSVNNRGLAPVPLTCAGAQLHPDVLDFPGIRNRI